MVNQDPTWDFPHMRDKILCEGVTDQKRRRTKPQSFLQRILFSGAININTKICHSPLSHIRGGQLQRHFRMSHRFRGNFSAPSLFPLSASVPLRCPSRAAKGLLLSRCLLHAGARAGPHFRRRRSASVTQPSPRAPLGCLSGRPPARSRPPAASARVCGQIPVKGEK